MSRYPLWKYILVVLVMFYAVVYTLPNFYETYPSINITNYENWDISESELTKLTEDKSISYKGLDGKSIFFESIDDQLSAYNKLSSDQKFKYTLSNYNQIPNGYMQSTPSQSRLDSILKVAFTFSYKLTLKMSESLELIN